MRLDCSVQETIEPGDRGGRRLYAATRTTLAERSCAEKRVPPTFELQVRDFLAVHDKVGKPCPRCGTKITEVRAGGFITSYCRGCQR